MKQKSWHAVSIVPKIVCCEAVKRMRHLRFLSAEAPRLPLENCPLAHRCACTYRHHEDRRGAPRRQGELHGLRRSRHPLPERRNQPDRRHSD